MDFKNVYRFWSISKWYQDQSQGLQVVLFVTTFNRKFISIGKEIENFDSEKCVILHGIYGI